LLYNVTCRLNPGGWFIGTIPDSFKIVKELRAANGLDIGNEVYSLRSFESKVHFKPFGSKYIFSLEDSVDDCPEFLVHMKVLRKIADEFDLDLKLDSNFHHFFQDQIKSPTNVDLLWGMKALDENGRMTQMEWEAAGLYKVFAFQKRGDPSSLGKKPFRKMHVHVSEDQIIKIRGM